MARRPDLIKATDEDWYLFTGMSPPREWFGLVAKTDFLIYGIGGAFLGTDGRWWATFRRARGVRLIKMAQVAARETMAFADDMGLTLHALPDDSITGARKWLARLGFEETEEALEGHNIWVRKSVS